MMLIEAKGVSRTLGGQLLFEDQHLTVVPGDVVLLKGRNGSGKSTFLRALRGEHPIDSGSVKLAGLPIESWKPWERELWAPSVDQDPILNWDVSAVDNLVDRLTVGAPLFKWFITTRRKIRQRILNQNAELIEQFGLATAMQRPARELSLGQRRLLTLLRALRPRPDGKPRVLLLDEPLAGLQRERVGTVLSILRQRIEAGWAVIVAEHLSEIEQLHPRPKEVCFPANQARVTAGSKTATPQALIELPGKLSVAGIQSNTSADEKTATSNAKPPKTENCLLKLTGGSAGYYDWAVVSHIDLMVIARQITALVGPNAVGKSTIFRGLFNGEAWLRGHLVWRGTEVQHLRDDQISPEAVAWVPQERPPFYGETVETALRGSLVGAEFRGFAARLKDLVGGLERLQQQRLKSLLELLPELHSLLKQKMETLSGGQRALVALGIGLINTPTVIFLDEPAANLDPTAMATLKTTLRRYLEQHDAGCLLIEHRASFTDNFADTTVTLNNHREVRGASDIPDSQSSAKVQG